MTLMDWTSELLIAWIVLHLPVVALICAAMVGLMPGRLPGLDVRPGAPQSAYPAIVKLAERFWRER
jgi:hypothetical protein